MVELPAIDPASFDKWQVFKTIQYEPDEWQYYFHESEALNRLLACGVRVGKTFAAGAEGSAAALCPSPLTVAADEWVGSRGWVVGNTYDTADKVWRLIYRNLKKHYPWMVLKGTSEANRIIKTPGDGFVIAKSADNPDSLIGEELDWAIIDEAPRVKEWEKEEVKQRLITRNGWMASIGSPTNMKWFVRDFEVGQRNGVRYEWAGDAIDGLEYAGRKPVFVHAVDEHGFSTDPEHEEYFSILVPTHANHRLDIKILADWERKMSDRIFRQDVLGEFMGADGTVFKNFERLLHADRLARGVRGQKYAMGWDVARTRDYSVLSVVDRHERKQVFIDRFKGPWNYQIERVMKIARYFNRPDIVVDATGKGDAVAEELQRRNILAQDPSTEEGQAGPFAGRIMPFVISTNKVKRELIENLAVAIDHGEIDLLDDPHQNHELRVFEFKVSEATGTVKYGAPKGFNDDCVLALCLAWHLCAKPMGSADIFM